MRFALCDWNFTRTRSLPSFLFIAAKVNKFF
jgi:hypothetical protein